MLNFLMGYGVLWGGTIVGAGLLYARAWLQLELTWVTFVACMVVCAGVNYKSWLLSRSVAYVPAVRSAIALSSLGLFCMLILEYAIRQAIFAFNITSYPIQISMVYAIIAAVILAIGALIHALALRYIDKNFRLIQD